MARASVDMYTWIHVSGNVSSTRHRTKNGSMMKVCSSQEKIVLWCLRSFHHRKNKLDASFLTKWNWSQIPSRNILYDEFGIYSEESCLSPNLHFPLILGATVTACLSMIASWQNYLFEDSYCTSRRDSHRNILWAWVIWLRVFQVLTSMSKILRIIHSQRRSILSGTVPTLRMRQKSAWLNGSETKCRFHARPPKGGSEVQVRHHKGR